MGKKQNILNYLNQQYFWDVNVKNLHPDRSKKLIIERVFTLGTIDELKKMLDYYGSEEVCNVLKNLNYLDDKSLNFASKLFNQPLKSFKCYRRKQSNPQHWHL